MGVQPTTREGWLAAAGLFVGPAAWFAAQQVGYASVGPICVAGGQSLAIPAVELAFAMLAAAGGLLSWRIWRTPEPQAAPRQARRRFTALLGVLLATLFTLVILMQAAAGLVFTGCEL